MKPGQDSLFKNIIKQLVNISKSAFGLTRNVSELSHNLYTQKDYISQVHKDNSETLEEAKLIKNKTSVLGETAEKADEASRSGREKQKNYLDEINQLSDSIEQGKSFINKFKKRSEEISKTTQLIMDLSARLDVLAINGAIEAARQGASGAGFSVIAREMKNLALETEKSAQNVETIIKEFNASSADIAEIFHQSSESLKTSRNEAGAIYELFSDIENLNAGVNRESSEIRLLINSMVNNNGSSENSVMEIEKSAEHSTKQVDLVENESTELQESVKAILTEMGEIKLDWHEKALAAVKEIAEEMKMAQAPFNSRLSHCFSRYPYIELLYILDDQGVQLENNVVHPDFTEQIDNTGAGQNRNSRPYYLKPGSEGFYISGIYLSSAVNHLCLTISVEFYNNSRRYILAADINLEAFVSLN